MYIDSFLKHASSRASVRRYCISLVDGSCFEQDQMPFCFFYRVSDTASFKSIGRKKLDISVCHHVCHHLHTADAIFLHRALELHCTWVTHCTKTKMVATRKQMCGGDT